MGRLCTTFSVCLDFSTPAEDYYDYLSRDGADYYGHVA